MAGRCRERRYADHTFIQIYFRMHHFVVKLSKFLRFRRQGSIDSPNQNPADIPDNRLQFSGGMCVQRGANVARLRETTTGNGQKKEKRAPKARRGESVGRHCDVAAMNTLNRR